MTIAAEGSPLRWTEKLVFAMATVPPTLLVTVVSPVLPGIQHAFAAYPNAAFLVKMIIGVNGFAMVIGCPLGGWLANRFNHRRLTAGAFLLFAVAGSLGLVVPDLYVLLFTRFLAAFAGAIGATVALVMLSGRTSGVSRDTLLGVMSGVGAFTAIVSSPLAGLLGQASWRLPFLIYLVMAAPALACMFTPDVAGKAAGAPPRNTGPFRSPAPYRLLLLALIVGLLLFGPFMYVPFHFVKMGVSDPRQISLGFTAEAVSGTIAGLLYGRVRLKLNLEQTMITSLLIEAAALAALTFSSTTTSAIAAMVTMGIGQTFASCSFYSVLAQLPERDRGPAFGLAKGAMYLSMLVGAVVLAPIDRQFGANGALITFSLLSAATAVYAFVLRGTLAGKSESAAADVAAGGAKLGKVS